MEFYSSGSVAQKNVLALIGYRAVGKNRSGRLAAEQMGVDFICCDEKIEALLGQSIASYVLKNGWAAFREAESNYLNKLFVELRQNLDNHYIVAFGGGIICCEENIALLRRFSNILWIDASVSEIQLRLEREEKEGNLARRPPLTSKGTIEEVPDVLEARRPLYQRASDSRIEVDGCTIAEVSQMISSHFSRYFPIFPLEKEEQADLLSSCLLHRKLHINM